MIVFKPVFYGNSFSKNIHYNTSDASVANPD